MNHEMSYENVRSICEAFLDEMIELNDLPGLAVGVTWGDQTFTGARGVRDMTTGDPLQATDVFHCASVSKLFTSSSVMKLVESGALNLNDRLIDILPASKDPRWGDIRLWQMLSHTAGIGDTTDYHWEQALTGEDALSNYVNSEEVTGRAMLCDPGKGEFHYSNDAYEMLGHIVAEKSAELAGEKLSYEGFVKRFLMEPAGMNDSTMLTFERIGVKAGEECPLITEVIRNRNAETGNTLVSISDSVSSSADPKWHPMALPHEKAEDRSIVPVTYYPYTRSHSPSSTLTSTVADLLKWAQAHIKGFAEVEAADAAKATDEAAGVSEVSRAPGAHGALLSFDSYQHIHYEYATVPNNGEKMGLGWFMRRQKGYQLYGHEGTDDGFRASFWICPKLDLGIVVLSNLSGAPVKKLNKKLFDLLVCE